MNEPTAYDHHGLEATWRDRWFSANLYRAEDGSPKPKKFVLVEFPYPSGSGLHCGHVYRFTMPDVFARKLRMDGHNVLFPIGWDAFGLPAEQYAVQTGVHPAETTRKAIATFRSQMQMLGYGFDFAREVDTTAPGYVKWTQWMFLQIWKSGLAELRAEPVWWCEALRTVLANEEVLDDGAGNKVSERGGHPVEKRLLEQWVIHMPRYAEALLRGLDDITFPESVRLAQQNWIGKSEGARLRFAVTGTDEELEVFTTRADTLLGATFMVLAPEHPLVDRLGDRVGNRAEVLAYRERARSRSDLERKSAKDKTGVRLHGVSVDHPLLAGVTIPVFVADYVLMDYGTGAIMAVPAHDERDFEFARTFDLPIPQTVYSGADNPSDALPWVSTDGYVEVPAAVRARFDAAVPGLPAGRLPCKDMLRAVVGTLAQDGRGKTEVTYRLRDWLFSRQRYWGEPIPIIHTKAGPIPVADPDDMAAVDASLPLVLPEVDDFKPTADGASPLARASAWREVKLPSGEIGLRETNTMPNWAGSCWYFLRYCDPHNEHAFADPDKLRYWLPVDHYFGGSEHTTLHLLYSRFWHRFLHDKGFVPTAEPYNMRMNGGILLGEDGAKMSKSIGNVVVPDDKVNRYGADALRLFICFMGPYDGTLPWSENGVKGTRRLVERIWALQAKVGDDAPAPDAFVRHFHKLVRRVGSMIDRFKTNTAVSDLMVFVRAAEGVAQIPAAIWRGFLAVLAPFAPFVADELWHRAHGWDDWQPARSIHLQSWPVFDPELARDIVVTLGVQIDGKTRAEVTIAADEAEESVRTAVLGLPDVQKWTDGKSIRKFIYVPGRIVNVVTGPA